MSDGYEETPARDVILGILRSSQDPLTQEEILDKFYAFVVCEREGPDGYLPFPSRVVLWFEVQVCRATEILTTLETLVLERKVGATMQNTPPGPIRQLLGARRWRRKQVYLPRYSYE